MNPYDVIKKPLLTEKSNLMKETGNKYVFEVTPRATKPDIKHAVEALFSVKVSCVHTMQYTGKPKRVGKNIGKKRDWKKAVVTLKEGSKIELFEGV